MSSRNLSDEEFLEKLRAHPELRGRMGGLLLAVEDEQGDLRTADAMEMKLIEELRQMGRESLSAWASSQVKKGTAEERQAGRVWQEGKKKLCWHTTFGEVSVEEPQLRRGSRRIRPFACRSQVSHRGCSRPLQRVVTDFAADVPFAQAMDKLVEHYGVLLPESTVRRITEGHARKVFEVAEPEAEWPRQAGCAVVVAETDGGMVPIVESGTTGTDRRKGKRLFWKEAKICLAHAQGSRTPVYGGTLQGDVDQAGQELFRCALKAGFGHGSRLHAVGDGAEWIAAQMERQFGANGRYLVDFYHVCDYLSAVAKALSPDQEAASAWLSTQKDRLKSSRAEELIQDLAAHLEAPDTLDAEAPVRCCHRYLSHRRGQLDYRTALADDLPIGSGEIESAHRYVVQQRLKRPGAWSQAANAEHMIALRILRANGQWKTYWANPATLAA